MKERQVAERQVALNQKGWYRACQVIVVSFHSSEIQLKGFKQGLIQVKKNALAAVCTISLRKVKIEMLGSVRN